MISPDYIVETKNSNPRKNPISKITIHHTASVSNGKSSAEYHASGARANCSANYYIGNAGELTRSVPEDRRAWTSSSTWNDDRAITIEVSNSKKAKPWPISDAAYKTLIKLCADICTRYGIDPHYTGDKNGTLTTHRMFVATTCPGDYIVEKLTSGEIENDIKKEMTGVVIQETAAPVASEPEPVIQTEPVIQPVIQPMAKKSNEELATEVIRGLWGNGQERKRRLTEAGYNYRDVQAIVNKRLLGR